MEATKSPLKFRKPKRLRLITFPQGDYDTWSKKQRALMEAHATCWATEYVKDFDAYMTAVRLGFDEADIKVAIRRYSKHWLVQSYVRQLQETFLEHNVATKDTLVAAAYRDAVDFSPRADPRSRVAAQKTLSTLLGLDVKEHKLTGNVALQGDDSMRGGVMFMPAPLTEKQWESKATEAQRQLKETVRQ